MEKIPECPQVRMLEPVLFNIFTNDLKKQVCSEIPKFVDRTKLYL